MLLQIALRLAYFLGESHMERCGTLVPLLLLSLQMRTSRYPIPVVPCSFSPRFFFFFLFPLQADSPWNYLEKYA